jgi:Uma2 family endonuclease
MTAADIHPRFPLDCPAYPIPSPPTDLPYDDGEPLETPLHRAAMNVLIRSLENAWADRTDFYTGGNMFLYYSNNQAMNRDFRGPDFFVALNVDRTSHQRKYWAIWDEGGKYPDVIVELMSTSTANVDLVEKKQLYERLFKTADYFVYDPYDAASLKGWHLDQNQQYQEIQPNKTGWLWCHSLGLWLGTWEGLLGNDSAAWLRFYDQQGNLILLPEEEAQQNLEQAQYNLEQARQQVEQAQQQVEQAQQQAEQERQKAVRLAERLRSLGIDPEES